MDLEKFVMHKNIQEGIKHMVAMGPMVAEFSPLMMEYVDGMYCAMDHYSREMNMMMDPAEIEAWKEYDIRFIEAFVTLVNSPNLHDGINRMLMAIVKEMDMQPGRLDSLVYSEMYLLENMKERIQEMDVKEIVKTMEKACEDIHMALKEGDWDKIKRMMDQMVMMIKDDKIWMTIETGYQGMMSMADSSMDSLYSEMTNMMLGMQMIREECVSTEDPISCCIDMCLEDGLNMLERLGSDMDSSIGAMESSMDGMMERMEREYVAMNWMMAPMTQKNGMSCMMEEAGLGVSMMIDTTDSAIDMIESVMGEEGAPVEVMKTCTDAKVKVMELMMGTCPAVA